MNLKKSLILVLLSISIPAFAQVTWSDRVDFRPEEDKYGSPELRYDLFGSWRTLQDRDIGDGALGLGVGVNYFFDRYFGVGADTRLEELDLPNHINASFIARYPFETTGAAPYLFAGAGRKFLDGGHWTLHIGGGFEYRINTSTGVFLDVRRTFADARLDSFLFRGGVRFGF